MLKHKVIISLLTLLVSFAFFADSAQGGQIIKGGPVGTGSGGAGVVGFGNFAAMDAYETVHTLGAGETGIMWWLEGQATAVCTTDGGGATDLSCSWDGANWTPTGVAASGLNNPLGADMEAAGFNMQSVGVITLKEQAEADADVAGEGQFWVDTAVPSAPMFTGDTGVDLALGHHPIASGDYASGSIVAGDIDLTSNFAMTGAWDFATGTMEIPNSATLPATCTVGTLYHDTDAAADARFNFCHTTNNWIAIPESGGGGLAEIVDDTTQQISAGDLDMNSNDITGTGNINITGTGAFSGSVDTGDHTATSYTSDPSDTGAMTITTDTLGAQVSIGITEASGPEAKMDLNVDTGAGTLTKFVELDGVGEVVNILKPFIISNGTSSGLLQIMEPSGSGTNNLTFIVPALAADTDYTWPIDDGDNNEVLKTNGSGVLEWVANAGAVSLIANGVKALATSEIVANSCASAVTGTATNAIAATDVLTWSGVGDMQAADGYGVASSGDGLVIYSWVATDLATFKVCNATGSAITPGALSLAWRIVR